MISLGISVEISVNDSLLSSTIEACVLLIVFWVALRIDRICSGRRGVAARVRHSCRPSPPITNPCSLRLDGGGLTLSIACAGNTSRGALGDACRAPLSPARSNAAQAGTPSRLLSRILRPDHPCHCRWILARHTGGRPVIALSPRCRLISFLAAALSPLSRVPWFTGCRRGHR